MAFILEFNESNSFVLQSSYDDVFNVLSDVPKAMSFHPAVHELEDLGNERYRLAMKKAGTKKHYHQTVYTCDYTSSKDDGRVVWKPVREDGNAWVDGSFSIVDNGNSCEVTMDVISEMTVPLPSLMKSLAYKIARSETDKMTKVYIDNLIEAFRSGKV